MVQQYFAEFFSRMYVDFSNPFLSVLRHVNLICIIIFLLLCTHQFLYLFLGLIKIARVKYAKGEIVPKHKYGIMISARNEEKVIGDLINSIRATNYPQELLDIFVIADNCTDKTAEIAKQLGCNVFVRNNLEQIGKGYALHFAFEKIHNDEQFKNNGYEGYFIFDADNILSENFFEEVNKVFNKGYDIVSSYRSSKNFSHNAITMANALWYLHDSRYLANPKMLLGINNGAVTGTGIVIRKNVIVEHDNWDCFCLVEDNEFISSCVAEGRKIGFSYDAIHYDEQVTTYKASVKQRERYMKGFLDVQKNVYPKLYKKMFKDFSCYDAVVAIQPVIIFMACIFTVNPICAIVGAAIGNRAVWVSALIAIAVALGIMLMIMLSFAGLPLITERKRIKANFWQRLKALIVFPLFMLDYFFVAINSLLKLKKIGWTPIKHEVNVPIENKENIVSSVEEQNGEVLQEVLSDSELKKTVDKVTETEKIIETETKNIA